MDSYIRWPWEVGHTVVAVNPITEQPSSISTDNLRTSNQNSSQEPVEVRHMEEDGRNGDIDQHSISSDEREVEILTRDGLPAETMQDSTRAATHSNDDFIDVLNMLRARLNEIYDCQQATQITLQNIQDRIYRVSAPRDVRFEAPSRIGEGRASPAIDLSDASSVSGSSAPPRRDRRRRVNANQRRGSSISSGTRNDGADIPSGSKTGSSTAQDATSAPVVKLRRLLERRSDRSLSSLSILRRESRNSSRRTSFVSFQQPATQPPAAPVVSTSPINDPNADNQSSSRRVESRGERFFAGSGENRAQNVEMPDLNAATGSLSSGFREPAESEPPRMRMAQDPLTSDRALPNPHATQAPPPTWSRPMAFPFPGNPSSYPFNAAPDERPREALPDAPELSDLLPPPLPPFPPDPRAYYGYRPNLSRFSSTSLPEVSPSVGAPSLSYAPPVYLPDITWARTEELHRQQLELIDQQRQIKEDIRGLTAAMRRDASNTNAVLNSVTSRLDFILDVVVKSQHR